MLAIELDQIGTGWIDDDRGVHAPLLLPTGMAVVPVGPALSYAEAVRERLARFDPRVAEARNTVHVERHQESVPVQGRNLIELVRDPQDDVLTLLEAEKRARNHPVDRACFC